MTLKFTPDGKVDRSQWGELPRYPLQRARFDDLCGALDECVAALREIKSGELILPAHRCSVAFRKIGAEP